MSEFPIHTADTAPDGAKATLEAVQAKVGFVPNLYGALAEAPAAAQGYAAISAAFASSSLSPIEQQVVLLTLSRLAGCGYCVAAHGTVAAKSGASDALITALQTGGDLGDAKLAALAAFTHALWETRGWVPEADQAAFLAAGFTRAQMLEVVTGAAVKTLSNYANHLIDTPVDPQFAARAVSNAA